MLLEKLKEQDNFTNHEKEAARYILEHPDSVPGMFLFPAACKTL